MRQIRVLIDFGASKQLTATVQTKPGTSIGSHGYSPVEQMKGGEAYPASDLFSLGATCFHLLTGISPFQLWIDHGYSWVASWRQHLTEERQRAEGRWQKGRHSRICPSAIRVTSP